MTVGIESHVADADVSGVEEASEVAETRRSLFRRVCLASAALYAGLAARGPEAAFAANWKCCTLARLDQWCGSCSCDPPFWCNYGGFKRVWYCCYGGRLYGCGECQSGTGTCHDGPQWYCSYGWLAFNDC